MSESALLFNLACERRTVLDKVLDIIKREIGDRDGTDAMLPLLRVREDVSALSIVAHEDVARLRPRAGEARQMLTPQEPDVPLGVCIFCRQHRSTASSVCDSYKAHHEFREEAVKPVPQPKKPDAKLCTKCGLHPRNPASATNGCEHVYPGAS